MHEVQLAGLEKSHARPPRGNSSDPVPGDPSSATMTQFEIGFYCEWHRCPNDFWLKAEETIAKAWTRMVETLSWRSRPEVISRVLNQHGSPGDPGPADFSEKMEVIFCKRMPARSAPSQSARRLLPLVCNRIIELLAFQT